MPTISLCMIFRNEENNIRRCLESVGCFTDEIVIADTGSTDRTKLILFSPEQAVSWRYTTSDYAVKNKKSTKRRLSAIVRPCKTIRALFRPSKDF